MRTLIPSDFRPAYKNKSISTNTNTKSIDPHTKNKSFSARKQKPSQFWPPHKNQVNFDPHTKTKSISIPRQKPSFDPNTDVRSISIQTLNQVIFDPHTKPSQFRSLRWNEVNSDLPHWNQVYFDNPHNNQVNSDVNTKTMSFSARFILRVIHTGTCFCDTAIIRSI